MIRHSVAAFTLVLFGLGLAGCGGSGTDPAKGVSAVLAPATNFLLVGETVTFTATVTLSNGQTSTTGAVFGSDNTAVASVDSATGKVTAKAFGAVTIFADIQGVRATIFMTVMPNFRGTWSGNGIIDACTQTGAFATAGFCTGVVGGGDAIALSITQNQTTVSGTITLDGSFTGSFTGTVSANGTLVINGTISLGSGFTLTIKNWATRSDVASAMTGTFTFTWALSGSAGNSDWTYHLVGMTRTAGGPTGIAPLSGGSGTILERSRAFSGGLPQ